MTNPKLYKLFVAACRIIFGATFICSGFVKAVDPWGTAIKVNEYLAIYGMEALRPCVMAFSIWLCGAELMMGLMMLFKVRIRLVSIFAVLSMLFFTVLTFLSATWLPVEDCGCFGDAVKFTPWQTFAKNAVLFPLAVVVWWRYRTDKIFVFTRLEIAMTVLFCTIGMGVGTLCYMHLPWIDFMPYKVGVNIHEAMTQASTAEPNAADEEIVLVYRNRRTGKLREFTLDDKAWHNESRWEWVETRVNDSASSLKRPLITEFNLHDAEGDATEELLTTKGKLNLLCVTSLDALSEGCAQKMRRLIEKSDAEGAQTVCITPEYLDSVTMLSIAGSRAVRFYNIDATTLKTLLRADAGLVELTDGVITRKLNCRDL